LLRVLKKMALILPMFSTGRLGSHASAISGTSFFLRKNTPRCFSDVAQIFLRHVRLWKDSGVTTKMCHASFYF